ncbi:MAG: single-stranded DNA-binding protein [Cyclobacteriaceae bacterium]|nr:single-stranded DNA-binding protein [Cyclobacteriaceae bacterium]
MKNLSNNVQLIGNLGKEPQIKEFESGKLMATFSIATTDYYTNHQGQRVNDTQWHQVVAWGKKAELVRDYVAKGNRIAISGKLVHRSYTDKDNQVRYITEILVNDLMLLTPKAESNAA